MLFPTFEFFIFFVITFLLYWYIFTKKKDRKVLLIIANFVFYSFYSLKFAVLMFIIAGLNFFFGITLQKVKNYTPKKIIFVFATVFNILYLLYFKEAYHLIDRINTLFPNFFTEKTYLSLISITAFVPLGVSYYIFKCCSYIFDVYCGKLNVRNSPLDVLLYVTFFPQVFSGPIENATSFFNQFETALTLDQASYKFLDFDRASLLIMLGLIKKTIVVSFLSLLITKPVFANPMNYNTAELLFAAVSYSVVIYADFSGYSDIANGIVLLLGFKATTNFDRPYTSKSITEFWRRWHISFSNWLRNYVYFSFGGSRFGLVKTIFALYLTMLIGGLWHGFKWTFVIWASLHGILLAIERILIVKKNNKYKNSYFLNSNYPKINETNLQKVNISKPKKNKITNTLKIIFTFAFVTFSWLFFQAESLSEVLLYFKSFINLKRPFKVINFFCVILIISTIGLQFIPKHFTEKAFNVYCKIPFLFKIFILVIGFLTMKLFTTSGVLEFIYFQF